jgi:hypothetical protein
VLVLMGPFVDAEHRIIRGEVGRLYKFSNSVDPELGKRLASTLGTLNSLI